MNQLLTRALLKTLEGLQPMIPSEDEDSDAKTSWQNLRWMAVTAIQNIETWPSDKTSRWIGFIQGVLAARGILDVDAERDRTRPLFHEAYKSQGLTPPTSQEMS